ncbi:MAG TPA: DNA polymerase III subunit beta [Clostridiales bacterium]|nr:DNA polymerase III subunit beta [Clostridiales bacterium]
MTRMFIRADKSVLQEAITPTLCAVAGKSTTAALECLMLHATEEGILEITGYDLNKGVKTRLPVLVLEAGGVLVNGSQLNAFIRSLPDGEVSIATDERLVTTISCKKSKFELHGISVDSFPTLPELNGEKRFELEQGLLKKMCQQVIFSVAQISTKPHLTGVLFEIKENNCRLVSCDGYRLSIRNEAISLMTGEEMSFIVPGKTIGELIKLLDESEEKVNVELTRKYIIFSFKEMIFFSRLIEDTYTVYQKSIPSEYRIQAKVELSEAMSSVERASLVIDEKTKSPLKCTLSHDGYMINCVTANGRVDEEFSIEFQGDDAIEIGFNYRFLLDAFRGAGMSGDNEVMLQLNSPTLPMIIRPVDHDEYLYLVLPIRL